MKSDSKMKNSIALLSSFVAFVGFSELIKFGNKTNNKAIDLLGTPLAFAGADGVRRLIKRSLTQNPEKELNDKIDPKYRELPIKINYHTERIKSEQEEANQLQR